MTLDCLGLTQSNVIWIIYGNVGHGCFLFIYMFVIIVF